jgi:hypothetical protein
MFLAPFKFIPLTVWRGVSFIFMFIYKLFLKSIAALWGAGKWSVKTFFITPVCIGEEFLERIEFVEHTLSSIKGASEGFRQGFWSVLDYTMVRPGLAFTFILWKMVVLYFNVVDWFIVRGFILAQTFYSYKWSPLRPVRWFFRARYTRLVMEPSEKMMLKSADFVEQWLGNQYQYRNVYRNADIAHCDDRRWRVIEDEFYSTVVNRRNKYNPRYHLALRHWNYLQACRTVDNNWESTRKRWAEYQLQENKRKDEALKRRKECYTNIALKTQKVAKGLFFVARCLGICFVVSGLFFGLVFAGIWVWDFGTWIFSVAPDAWAFLAGFWGELMEAWGELMEAGFGIAAFQFFATCMFIGITLLFMRLLYQGGFFGWLGGNIASLWNRFLGPIFRSLGMFLGPIFRSLGTVFGFFFLYLKVAKKNQCPGIDWDED